MTDHELKSIPCFSLLGVDCTTVSEVDNATTKACNLHYTKSSGKFACYIDTDNDAHVLVLIMDANTCAELEVASSA